MTGSSGGDGVVAAPLSSTTYSDSLRSFLSSVSRSYLYLSYACILSALSSIYLSFYIIYFLHAELFLSSLVFLPYLFTFSPSKPFLSSLPYSYLIYSL